MKIAYYLVTDIQHLPPALRIYEQLGGIIITKNKKIYDFAQDKYKNLNLEIYLVNGSHQARKLAKKHKIKLMIYTGFQMIYHGYSLEIFHGVSDKKYIQDKRVLLYDKLLMPGEKNLDKIKKAGYYKYPNRFEMIGYPKFDNILEISQKPLFNNNKKTILYAPTWISTGANVDFSEHGESSLELWVIDLIEEIAPHWNLIIKFHSRINRAASNIYNEIDEYIASNNLSGNVKTIWDDNILPYMNQSELMIGDISTVSYEWFHFDKPIVFANPAPKFYQPSKDINSTTFSWQAGDVLYKKEEIYSVISRNLDKDLYKLKRNEIFNYTIYSPDGKVTQRQINAITDFYNSIKNRGRIRAKIHNIIKVILYPFYK